LSIVSITPPSHEELICDIKNILVKDFNALEGEIRSIINWYRCGVGDNSLYKKPIPFGGMGKPVNPIGFSDHFPVSVVVREW